jgi:hypothetical protein
VAGEVVTMAIVAAYFAWENVNVHGRKARDDIYSSLDVPAAKEKYLVVDVREILTTAGSPAGGIFFRAQASLVGTR